MTSKKDNKTTPDFFSAMSTETHKLMQYFGGPKGEEAFDRLNAAWSEVMHQPQNPGSWLKTINAYQKNQLDFWSTLFPPKSDPNKDRRFKADEWTDNPVFNYIKESYLVASSMLNHLASSAPLDERKKKKLEFFTQQYIDAMSPTNFAATNPEVIQQALETNGQSLIDGMKNLLGDIERGRISQTSESDFTLGKDLATTPGSVIFENELMQLIHYQPMVEKVAERPLVIVPACINKFYILDLQPENSFVRYALENGQNVFIVSWVNANPSQSQLSWDDYVGDGVLKAIEVAKAIAGAKQVNTVAWCIGGTITASALGVLAARKDNSVASATFLTTLTDFSDPGEIEVFIDDESIGKLLKDVRKEGILSGKSLASTFNVLRANDLIWSYVVNNYLKGQTPPPFDILYWNSDPTNLPAEMYAYYITRMYLNNLLVSPGGLTICGEAVDLSEVQTPCYFLSCIEDHIAPWKSTFAITDIMPNVDFILGASGHVAGVINPANKNRRNYWTDGKTGLGADHWLETAENIPGSWWNHWTPWLEDYSGNLVDAPKGVGSKDYPPLENAPGRFVTVRIN